MNRVIPLGYKSVDRKLVIDEKFSSLIKFIFERFSEVKSPEQVAKEANAKVLHEYSEEDAAQAKVFYRKRMYKILKNPLYKGYTNHHGTLYKGQHSAIIKEELWDQVQGVLEVPLKAPKAEMPLDFALKSRVRCKECDKAMVVCMTYKKTRNYAYYTCLNKHNGLLCKGLNINVNAELVHRLVIEEVRKILKEPESLGGLWQKLSEDSSPEDAYKRLQNIDGAWDLLPPDDQNKIIQEFVKTVWMSQQGLTIELTPDGLGFAPETQKLIVIPGTFYNRKNKLQVFVKKDEDNKDPALLKALVQAEIWLKEMNSGKYSSYEEIAVAYGLNDQYIRKNLSFAFLSPRIKEAILFGKLSPQFNLIDFNLRRPPRDWEKQEEMFLSE
ncbi:MAG: recombinase family protein [Holosporales bacterium]|jgi:hypothetical protein|nr:recombinase family protein [Holosporales bacterium]